jgi:hypothetical protein
VASAWGNSWGAAWGNSWGSVSPLPPAPVIPDAPATGGGPLVRPDKKRRNAERGNARDYDFLNGPGLGVPVVERPEPIVIDAEKVRADLARYVPANSQNEMPDLMAAINAMTVGVDMLDPASVELAQLQIVYDPVMWARIRYMQAMQEEDETALLIAALMA